MKKTRKLFCAVLAVALIVISVVPAFAVQFDTTTKTVYLSSSDPSVGQSTYWFYVYDMDKNDSITNLKTSNKNIVGLYAVEHRKTEYFESKNESADAEIAVRPLKAGNATISFKVAGKTYKKKIVVKGYQNPVKSLVISGISNKNLKSKFAKSYSARDTLNAKIKAGNVTVSAASGWKIRSLYMRSNDKDYSGIEREVHFGGDGVASAKLAMPAMSEKDRYQVTINFYNKAADCSMYIYYYLDPASSNR